VTVPEEKLAGVDQELAELGKSDEEIFEVRNRFASEETADLQAVDSELGELSEGVSIEPFSANAAEAVADQAAAQEWDNEATEVAVIDESDFVLLVDEDDLEELEKAGEEAARVTTPPALPQEGEEGEGFFKKLFSGRRSSNRPSSPPKK
jgi:hypothetical protein